MALTEAQLLAEYEASLAAAHEAQREHEEHEVDDEEEWKAAPNPDLSEAVSRKNDAMIRAVETGDVAAVWNARLDNPERRRADRCFSGAPRLSEQIKRLLR